MRKLFSIVMILYALIFSVSAQRERSPDNTPSLVEAERAFAKASVDKGMRAAFLEYLADSSIVFQPGPVNGQKWWKERPVRPGVLTWEPIFAFVARSNDLGYTTGPWEFRPKTLEDKPVAFGNFVSVWKRQPNGNWKVALDIGTDNPAPVDAPVIEFSSDAPRKERPHSRSSSEADRIALLRAEHDFTRLFSAKNTVDSYLSYFAADVRIFRMNVYPPVGKNAARAMFQTRPTTLTWRQVGADVSVAGDLGYTYGTYEFLGTVEREPKETGSYLKIWRRGARGQWKIVLDLVKPDPPPAAPTPAQ